MGLIKFLFKTSIYGAGASAATFALLTRKSQFVPMSPPTDELFNSKYYAKTNPNKNPSMYDLCVRKVRLDKIRPELVENPEELTRSFCAGVWSGKGYDIQRFVMAKKYQGPATAHQLWSVPEMLRSDYSVGTQITDHFEVIEKSPEAIVVRAGGSPTKTGLREMDGLFSMGAKVLPEENCVEFSLKTVFYQGLGKAETKPMPEWIEFLHRVYDKALMETAIWNCMK